ncbi:MAG: 2-C-methyl-D-erythritol 4-phosphate cytidylyltransferase [Lachnospiraceae bacterium]|nr:2-C-methyl-D-erythritol 4-phosphate cytidylyltransferase [Lachnospiraceae bacterium]
MVVAGIVAGGIGSRMGNSSVPKQFLEIGDKPIIIHTIEKFLVSLSVDYIVVGVHADWQDYMEDLLRKYLNANDSVFITTGGSNRNETIRNIITKADELWGIDETTIFVTHDAVRPFVSLEIIEENVRMAEKYGVCDTVVSATDTIVRSSNDEYITDIPLRGEMYQGQTPQSFQYGEFKKVYESMTEEELNIVTDACKMFFLRNRKVHLVRGSVLNFKITYPFDFKMAKVMLEENR